MLNKKECQIALDTLFDNIDLYDEDDIERCIKAKKILQELINDHFDKTAGIINNGQNAKNIVVEKGAFMNLNIGVKKNGR